MAIPIPYRIQQVVAYRRAAHLAPPVIPEGARGRLTAPMAHQFRILPVGDQIHLIEVYEELTRLGADDDTVTAGLIHDVGKACAKCRITIVDRGLHVVFSRVARGPYARFASMETSPSWCRGLHRLANHAERGALAAEQAGYNDRVIELVRLHERGGARNDQQLALLRRADDKATRS